MRVYYNFFQPVLRQIERSVHYKANHAPVLVRKQDTARMPLKRLTESDVLDPKTRVWPRWTYVQTNPRRLRREVQRLLDTLFDTLAR